MSGQRLHTYCFVSKISYWNFFIRNLFWCDTKVIDVFHFLSREFSLFNSNFIKLSAFFSFFLIFPRFDPFFHFFKVKPLFFSSTFKWYTYSSCFEFHATELTPLRFWDPCASLIVCFIQIWKSFMISSEISSKLDYILGYLSFSILLCSYSISFCLSNSMMLFP